MTIKTFSFVSNIKRLILYLNVSILQHSPSICIKDRGLFIGEKANISAKTSCAASNMQEVVKYSMGPKIFQVCFCQIWNALVNNTKNNYQFIFTHEKLKF